MPVCGVASTILRVSSLLLILLPMHMDVFDTMVPGNTESLSLSQNNAAEGFNTDEEDAKLTEYDWDEIRKHDQEEDIGSYNNSINDTAIKVFNSSQSKFDFFIFQIGFNKVGTTSLLSYFIANDIPSVHFSALPSNTAKRKVKLHRTMFANYLANRYVLEPYHNTFMYYSDFGVAVGGSLRSDILFLEDIYSLAKHREWFQILTKQYTNAKFILNIRNVNHWIRSRFTYNAGTDSVKRRYNNVYKTDIDVIRAWKTVWYRYICDLLRYFEDNDIVDNLVIFDIEREDPSKLVFFFKQYNVTLNGLTSMPKKLTTQGSGRTTTAQFEKWHNITALYPEFQSDEKNEREEIAKICGSNIPFTH
eukprot:60235_1